jgi:hypothetical protein
MLGAKISQNLYLKGVWPQIVIFLNNNIRTFFGAPALLSRSWAASSATISDPQHRAVRMSLVIIHIILDIENSVESPLSTEKFL